MSDVAQKEEPTPNEEIDLFTFQSDHNIKIKFDDIKVRCKKNSNHAYMECISQIPWKVGEQVWKKFKCPNCGSERFIRFWI